MARDPAPAAAASRRLIVLLAIGLAAVVAAYLIAKAEGSDNFGLFITAAGGLSVMIAVQLALTARALKAARSELADEHARLERMFLDARIGMVLVDDDGRWVRVNPAVCAMLGYSQEELENSSFPELTHQADLRDVNRTNQGKEFEKRYITRERNEIWALVNVSPITEWQRGARFQVEPSTPDDCLEREPQILRSR